MHSLIHCYLIMNYQRSNNLNYNFFVQFCTLRPYFINFHNIGKYLFIYLYWCNSTILRNHFNYKNKFNELKILISYIHIYLNVIKSDKHPLWWRTHHICPNSGYIRQVIWYIGCSRHININFGQWIGSMYVLYYSKDSTKLPQSTNLY